MDAQNCNRWAYVREGRGSRGIGQYFSIRSFRSIVPNSGWTKDDMTEISRNKLGPFQEGRLFIIKVEPKTTGKIAIYSTGK